LKSHLFIVYTKLIFDVRSPDAVFSQSSSIAVFLIPFEQLHLQRRATTTTAATTTTTDRSIEKKTPFRLIVFLQ
jgi:hypothetical protein